MANNRLVIGRQYKKETEEINIDVIPAAIPNIEQEPSKEPLDINVWGNDYSIVNKLNEEQLADRRMYVRVIYMQRIVCSTIFDSMESEHILLRTPIEFTIIDISVGGIGIICEDKIDVGAILVFVLTLDNIEYEIMCEVVYCFQNYDRYRAGLKVVHKDKDFTKHLKILVARLSLQNKYGSRINKA